MDDWRKRSVCKGVDVEVFHPKAKVGRGGGPADYTEARRYCSVCPVQLQCLELILWSEDPRYGVGMYGNTTPEQRRTMRRSMPRGKV